MQWVYAATKLVKTNKTKMIKTEWSLRPLHEILHHLSLGQKQWTQQHNNVPPSSPLHLILALWDWHQLILVTWRKASDVKLRVSKSTCSKTWRRASVAKSCVSGPTFWEVPFPSILSLGRQGGHKLGLLRASYDIAKWCKISCKGSTTQTIKCLV